MRNFLNALPDGYDFIHLSTCESTMDEGFLWLKMHKKNDHTVVILADQQTQGRGRHQRAWRSLEGNLFVSFVSLIPPEKHDLGQLSIVGGVALGAALRSLCPHLIIQYKWPNDIMITGQKVAGILTEAHEISGKRGFVMGMGVNIAEAPLLEGRYKATSLKKEGVTPLSSLDVLTVLVPLFDRYKNLWLKEGFLRIVKQWNQNALYHQEMIRIMTTKGPLEGVFKGIDSHGFLTIQVPSGEVQSFSTAEIL